MLALLAMSLGASFNGCTCSGEAKMGNNMEAKQPEPPPPAPPPAPTAAPTQDTTPPPPVKVVKNVKLEGNKVTIPGELEFDVDKATIKNSQQSTDILQTLALFMKENPNVTKLRIEGHTDNTGTVDHNKKLSNDRAAAVAKWLSTNGIEAVRLKTVGYGQDKPLVPNDSAEHKAQNRRTEFHVEEIDGKPAPTADSSGGASGGAGTTPAGSGTAAPTGTAGDTTAAAAPGAKPDKKKGDKKGDKKDADKKGGDKKDADKAPTPAGTGTSAPKP
jgi:outer membrane protein OmpA-like peptidoglycan-associated protein